MKGDKDMGAIVRTEFDELFEDRRPSFAMGPFQLLAHDLIEHAIHEVDLDWIMEEDIDYPCSFDNCCMQLGYSVAAARKSLYEKLKDVKRQDVIRSYNRRAVVCQDIPGKKYSHPYGECPAGVACSRCAECRNRYNYFYRLKAARKAA